ncbi:hypothetical protein B0H11DRAFT_2039015 [Mycena galericulata]|nr:hypothetical protein B0H11DRAFT_2045093 [Mycena galericulata]KAJ7472436.1 hypothetical protein B0H11DRAFT_2039015 [Mycena galericulata]
MSSQVPRKLLILDLNGTLLLRSKHTRQGRPSMAHLGTRSRIVHPRPYLKSFREYIFHPSTMAWLDTMVWSSAQPPSVADMVNHCFAEQQRKFLAIWARDTLGLSPAQYHQKTRTTKDLAKPWTAFPAHSARTTLLLDDSARKAHLHPHNHVCVREYIQETRTRDLEVWQKSNNAMAEKPKKKARAKSKKILKDSDLAAPLEEPPAWVLSSSRYDETLLAVVGILETIKTQPDVAEWIGGGGLLLKEQETPAEMTKQEESSRPPSSDALASQLDALNLQELWFNSEATVGHWVEQGLHTLEALQIEVAAGIRSEPAATH